MAHIRSMHQIRQQLIYRFKMLSLIKEKFMMRLRKNMTLTQEECLILSNQSGVLRTWDNTRTNSTPRETSLETSSSGNLKTESSCTNSTTGGHMPKEADLTSITALPCTGKSTTGSLTSSQPQISSKSFAHAQSSAFGQNRKSLAITWAWHMPLLARIGAETSWWSSHVTWNASPDLDIHSIFWQKI